MFSLVYLNFSGEVTRTLGWGVDTFQSTEEPVGWHVAGVSAVRRDACRVWALAGTDWGGPPCQPSECHRD